jgi:hypothetical protein
MPGPSRQSQVLHTTNVTMSSPPGDCPTAATAIHSHSTAPQPVSRAIPVPRCWYQANYPAGRRLSPLPTTKACCFAAEASGGAGGAVGRFGSKIAVFPGHRKYSAEQKECLLVLKFVTILRGMLVRKCLGHSGCDRLTVHDCMGYYGGSMISASRCLLVGSKINVDFRQMSFAN